MKIILLMGKTYQVVNDSESTVFFQGTKMECLEYFYGITTQRKLI